MPSARVVNRRLTPMGIVNLHCNDESPKLTALTCLSQMSEEYSGRNVADGDPSRSLFSKGEQRD